jgi:hypothetical protein
MINAKINASSVEERQAVVSLPLFVVHAEAPNA